MKIFSKYMFIILAGCLALTSCDSDDEYSAGPQNEGAAVSFGLIEANGSVTYLPTDEPKLVLEAQRADATSALDVPITVVSNDVIGETPVFNIPESIHFDANSKTASLEITFPNAELGTSYSFEIQIADGYQNLYATNTIRRTVLRDYEWVSYSGALVTEFDGIDSEVVIQKAKDYSIWRVVDPFADFIESGDYSADACAQYITFYVNDDKSVTFDTFENELYQGSQVYATWPIEVNPAYTNYVADNKALDSYNVQLVPIYYVPSLGGGFGAGSILITLDKGQDIAFGDFGDLSPEDSEGEDAGEGE